MSSAVLREFHRTRQRPPRPLFNAYLVSLLIAKLRENWHQLHDIDRALAVREFIELGVSRRRLAREIGDVATARFERLMLALLLRRLAQKP